MDVITVVFSFIGALAGSIGGAYLKEYWDAKAKTQAEYEKRKYFEEAIAGLLSEDVP